MGVLFLFRMKGGIAADLHRNNRQQVLNKTFGMGEREWHSQVGDLSAEEAIVVGAVFIVGVDVFGETPFVDHVSAGGDEQHRLVALKDVDAESVCEAHAT